jgi:predicted membrane channel-forming protein YqfA (hemolysin III family)
MLYITIDQILLVNLLYFVEKVPLKYSNMGMSHSRWHIAWNIASYAAYRMALLLYAMIQHDVCYILKKMSL